MASTLNNLQHFFVYDVSDPHSGFLRNVKNIVLAFTFLWRLNRQTYKQTYIIFYKQINQSNMSEYINFLFLRTEYLYIYKKKYITNDNQ